MDSTASFSIGGVAVLLQDVGAAHPLPLIDGDAAIEGHDADAGLGHLEGKVEGLAGQRGGVELQIFHPVFDRVTGYAEVLLLQLLHAGQHRVAPDRVLDVEHRVEPVANDDLRGPGLDALQQVLVTPEEPRDELFLGELDGVRARAEQSGVDDARRCAVSCCDALVGIVVSGVGGQELVPHAFELGDDLVVPGGPLDLGHRVGAVPLAHLGRPPVDAELHVPVTPRQELGGERLRGEVREAQVGPVRTAVVGELGTGVDVELLADVEAGSRVRHAIVDTRELREVDQVDAEHEDEVVGDDTLLEVGSRLADLQELLELRIGRRFGHVVLL